MRQELIMPEREFIQKRVEPIVEVLEKANLAKEIDPYEAYSLVQDLGLGPKEWEKAFRTMMYIRQRFVYKKTRYEAFKIAFPDRFSEDMARQTVETKARRVESYKVYKKIVSVLHTSLYVSYAFDRMQVLDLALRKIFNQSTKEHYRIEYMKLFLQETRKPDEAKQLELNIDVKSDGATVSRIEDKLNQIAKKLEGASAKDILGLHNGSK